MLTRSAVITKCGYMLHYILNYHRVVMGQVSPADLEEIGPILMPAQPLKYYFFVIVFVLNSFKK